MQSLINANLGEHLLHDADGYSDKAHQMPRTEYVRHVRNSLFQLNLPGNYNLDTFRLSETMEAGAAPIVTRQGLHQHYNYIDGVYGPDHPVLQLESWDDAPTAMSQLMGRRSGSSRGDQLDAYRLAVVDYWQSLKWSIRMQMAFHIEAARERACAGK